MASIVDVIKNENSTKEDIQAAVLGQMQKTEQFREQGGRVTYGVVCTDLHSGITGLTRAGSMEAAVRMNTASMGSDRGCLYIPMAFIDSKTRE